MIQCFRWCRYSHARRFWYREASRKRRNPDCTSWISRICRFGTSPSHASKPYLLSCHLVQLPRSSFKNLMHYPSIFGLSGEFALSLERAIRAVTDVLEPRRLTGSSLISSSAATSPSKRKKRTTSSDNVLERTYDCEFSFPAPAFRFTAEDLTSTTARLSSGRKFRTMRKLSALLSFNLILRNDRLPIKLLSINGLSRPMPRSIVTIYQLE